MVELSMEREEERARTGTLKVFKGSAVTGAVVSTAGVRRH
jgi:hypothetical protein